MFSKGLVSFKIAEKETDLLIMADSDLSKIAKEAVLKYRFELELYIKNRPEFKTSLLPLSPLGAESGIIKEMIRSSRLAGVGPMASVAGTMADFIGKDLSAYSSEVIVENGGDIFIKSKSERLFGVYAGNSPLSDKIALKVKNNSAGSLGICTSSGSVGPSLSFGNSDATVIVSKNASIADAFATLIGNMVKSETDLEAAINKAKSIDDIIGALIIIGDKMAICKDIEIVKI